MADQIDYGGIDHVQLAMPVDGEAEARHFFGSLLGLIEVDKPPRLAARGPAFVVRDLELLRRRLDAAGAEVVQDGAIAGVHRFYTADPFGNRLEFVAESDRGFTALE